MEHWLDIPGYEGAYQVSDLGRVRSLDRVVVRRDGRRRPFPGRLLRPAASKSGHLTVVLGRGHTQQVHYLVLLAFIGPRPDGLEIRHRNGKPADNRLRNLCYGTKSANMRDIPAHGGSRQRYLPAWVVKAVRSYVAHGIKQVDVAEALGLSRGVVNHIVTGRTYAYV